LAKPVPKSLTALGRRSLPRQIELRGEPFTLKRVFKNDFFAVTALYERAGEKVVLKVHRQAWFLLIPLRWVGRVLAARECTAFQRLRDVDGVPRLIERWGPTGVVREYIEGKPLTRKTAVDDDFFPRLDSLLDEMHNRDMAYVDLEKCENVLVGEDGRPYLFDFQICWYVPRRWGGGLWPMRKLMAWFQNADRYHLTKLHRRVRPDQLTPEAIRASYRKPWYVHWHRFFTWPFLWGRRRVLDRIDPRRAEGERGRVHEDEMIGAR
jgi:hypothetical protein